MFNERDDTVAFIELFAASTGDALEWLTEHGVNITDIAGVQTADDLRTMCKMYMQYPAYRVGGLGGAMRVTMAPLAKLHEQGVIHGNKRRKH